MDSATLIAIASIVTAGLADHRRLLLTLLDAVVLDLARVGSLLVAGIALHQEVAPWRPLATARGLPMMAHGPARQHP